MPHAVSMLGARQLVHVTTLLCCHGNLQHPALCQGVTAVGDAGATLHDREPSTKAGYIRRRGGVALWDTQLRSPPEIALALPTAEIEIDPE
jgi:hypothetical protein